MRGVAWRRWQAGRRALARTAEVPGGAVAPPAALIALPIMCGAACVSRMAYDRVHGRARLHLERGEPLVPRRG
jgi:hypothetical protein